MTKYEFTLILKGQLELTEEIADELFEAGCDDGTPGICNGVFSIDFHRKANSLEEAIRSAIGNVKSAGYEVERVEIEAEAMPQPA
jgi:regulator of RNase E activity RraB